MTTTVQTPKRHIDGGTFTEVAYAQTRNRWGICITRRVFRGKVSFEVHRVSPDHKMLRLGYFSTEQEARSYGNSMWLRDR